MTQQKSSGITISWPMFLIIIAGIAAFVYWTAQQAVNAKDIGEAAGAAAAESMKDQADEIIDQAMNKTADEVVDRSGEMVDKVLTDTIEKATEQTTDRVKDISVDDIFGMFERVKDTGLRTTRDLAYDLDPISLDDEWAYGQELGDILREEMVVVTDSKVKNQIERLAEPIYQMLERTAGKEYQITIMESDEVNAFAILGGQIFLATGLIQQMETDHAIQAVLAHEIAHVELEHCVRGSWFGQQARGQLGTNVLSDLMTNSFHLLAERGFTEQQELESDAYAFHAQHHLGVSRQDRLRFIAVLWELETAHSSAHTDQEDENKVLAVLNRHYRTHPPASERYEELMKIEDAVIQP